MRFLATVISGVVVGAVGLYLTLNWQEEKLDYSLSAPAQFGDIIYQNLRITNVGWDPATNVVISVDSFPFSTASVRSAPALQSPIAKGEIGRLDRIRRNEIVTVSFSYSGQALSASAVSIKSDRSIAELKEDQGWELDWRSFCLGLGALFLFALSGVIVPAARDYKRRALQRRFSEQTDRKPGG